MRVVVTAEGPLMPLVGYFSERQAKSLGWQGTTACAMGLLIDWMKCKADHYADPDARQGLLADFALAVLKGTIGLDGTDPSGLYWEATSSKRANAIVHAACACSDWLVRRYGATSLDAGHPTTLGERIAYWRRMESRTAGELLRHTGPSERAKDAARRTRNVSPFRTPQQHGGVEAVKKFPENRISDLLFRGLAGRGVTNRTPIHLRYNIRDILITILMHGGGRRTSESFHLYTTDVWPDPETPGSALVRIYHPQEGAMEWTDPVTQARVAGPREKFLRDVYNREPRNVVIGERSAGWKNPALTDESDGKYIQVFWFPAFWGKLFWALYTIYINRVYPTRKLDHPYLFVSFDRSFYGRPYTLHSFRTNHAAAVRRIGLPVSKRLGTTPHGHRHAMGARLDGTRVPGKIQSLALAHHSLFSRLVYNERTLSEVKLELDKAAGGLPQSDTLNQLDPSRLEEELSMWVEAVDPALRLAR